MLIEQNKKSVVHSKHSFVGYFLLTSWLLFSQVRSLQTDGPLSCGLQGQHASFWRRWESEFSKEQPVEVQLHHSDMDAGRHPPRLKLSREDSPLLHRTRPQLQVQKQSPLLQLSTQTQAAGWENKALQEQVLSCQTHFPRIRGSHRAGDLQPRPVLQ